jgi:hypothetical protein
MIWSLIQPAGILDAQPLPNLVGAAIQGTTTIPVGAMIVAVASRYPPDPLWPGGGPWDLVLANDTDGPCGRMPQVAPAAWGSSPPCGVRWLVGARTTIAVGYSDNTNPLGVATSRRLFLGWLPKGAYDAS